jgi:toxin YoeB
MRVSFSKEGWEDYQFWIDHDRKILRKINELIRDTLRHPFEGIGKPEPLRNELAGFWSRRVTNEHRLVYRVEQDELFIIQCRYHY